MPVLPLIDLLILIAWTSLIFAGLLKAVGVAMAYPYGVLGMHPLDFVYVACAALLFALALAARVWVRVNEPMLQRGRRDSHFPNEPEPPLGAAGAELRQSEELRAHDRATAG